MLEYSQSQNHYRNKSRWHQWHVTYSYSGAKSEILIISFVCRWYIGFQNLVTYKLYAYR